MTTETTLPSDKPLKNVLKDLGINLFNAAFDIVQEHDGDPALPEVLEEINGKIFEVTEQLMAEHVAKGFDDIDRSDVLIGITFANGKIEMNVPMSFREMISGPLPEPGE